MKTNPKQLTKWQYKTYIQIITLNVNKLNAPTKRHRLTESMQKQDPYMLFTGHHFRSRGTYRLKGKGWKKVFHANGNQQKAGIAILISDKIDFKIKARDKDYTVIKGTTQEEDTTIVNIYAQNIGSHQYIRQMLTDIKGEINSNTIIVGDFNTTFTPMDRSYRQKISEETQALNDTLDQMNLIDIYTTFIRKQQNTHSFQVHMKHSPGQITCWATNQTLENLRKLKLYQASFLTTPL